MFLKLVEKTAKPLSGKIQNVEHLVSPYQITDMYPSVDFADCTVIEFTNGVKKVFEYNFERLEEILSREFDIVNIARYTYY